MSTFINKTIIHFINSGRYGAITTGVAVIAAILLLILLIEKVLFDAYHGDQKAEKTNNFRVGIWPLLFTLAMLTVMRFLELLL